MQYPTQTQASSMSARRVLAIQLWREVLVHLILFFFCLALIETFCQAQNKYSSHIVTLLIWVDWSSSKLGLYITSLKSFHGQVSTPMPFSLVVDSEGVHTWAFLNLPTQKSGRGMTRSFYNA